MLTSNIDSMLEESIKVCSHLTALLAEDDNDFRNEMTQILKLFFKDVLVAKDGEEAIKLFETNKIHVVFLDYCMPKINGYEVACKIRFSKKALPIVFFSGYTDEEKLINVINLKVEGFVKKPFTQKLFLEVMSNICKTVLSDQNNLKILIHENLYYDFSHKTIIKNDVIIILTKSEIALIELLVKNKSHLISTALIESDIFNGQVEQNTLRNLVYRLRKKIDVPFILNIKDLGYMIP